MRKRGRGSGRGRGGSRDGGRAGGRGRGREGGDAEKLSCMWAMVGDKVEVRSDEEGFIGAWYAAEVVHLESSSSCFVEYEQLLSDNGSPLQELVSLSNLRPSPPSLPPRSPWLQGHLVEAYDRDGWWSGTVVRSLPEGNLVLVRFRTTGEELTFPPSLLRGLQNWDDGIWTDLTQVGRPDDDHSSDIAVLDGPSNHSSHTDLNGSSSPPHRTKKRGRPRNIKLPILELPCMPPEEMIQMREPEPCDDPEPFADPVMDTFKSHKRLNSCELQGLEEPQTPSSASDYLPSAVEASKSKIRLELIAYQLLVKALRLKGPLNWNQERLLTDVRMQLNITNAEQNFVLEGLMPSDDTRRMGREQPSPAYIYMHSVVVSFF